MKTGYVLQLSHLFSIGPSTGRSSHKYIALFLPLSNGHVHSTHIIRHVIASILLFIGPIQKNNVTKMNIAFNPPVTLQETIIRKRYLILQVHLFRDQVQMIPQAVNPFSSTTRLLHVLVSKEYLLPRQPNLIHLEYPTQL